MAMEDKPDLVAVLEYYAGIEGRSFTLRQTAGKVQIACPFHDDAHPSARINLETERFRCYANCGAPSGDSFDVIMEREGIDNFNEAKQWARDHVGYESGQVHGTSAPRRYRPSFGTDEDD